MYKRNWLQINNIVKECKRLENQKFWANKQFCLYTNKNGCK